MKTIAFVISLFLLSGCTAYKKEYEIAKRAYLISEIEKWGYYEMVRNMHWDTIKDFGNQEMIDRHREMATELNNKMDEFYKFWGSEIKKNNLVSG